MPDSASKTVLFGWLRSLTSIIIMIKLNFDKFGARKNAFIIDFHVCYKVHFPSNCAMEYLEFTQW